MDNFDSETILSNFLLNGFASFNLLSYENSYMEIESNKYPCVNMLLEQSLDTLDNNDTKTYVSITVTLNNMNNFSIIENHVKNPNGEIFTTYQLLNILLSSYGLPSVSVQYFKNNICMDNDQPSPFIDDEYGRIGMNSDEANINNEINYILSYRMLILLYVKEQLADRG